jgi:hypothetical protein
MWCDAQCIPRADRDRLPPGQRVRRLRADPLAEEDRVLAAVACVRADIPRLRREAEALLERPHIYDRVGGADRGQRN